MADPEQGGDTKPEPTTLEVKRRNSIELTKIDVPSAPPRDSNLSDQSGKGPYSRPEVIYAPEKIADWMSCLKTGLIAFNVCIWLVGLTIAGISIWFLVDPTFWTYKLNLDMEQFSTGAIIGIAVGVLIIIIGLIGCFGAINESFCLLTSYIVIAIILIIMEAVVVGIVWSAINNKDTQDKVASYINKGIGKRSDRNNYPSQYFLDLLQSNLECCGVKDADEYEEKVPKSCMDKSTGFLFEDGCVKKLMTYLKSKAAALGGITIAALLIQIGAVVFSVCLLCAVRQEKKAIF